MNILTAIFGSCRKFSGWGLLATVCVVCVGGLLSLASWAGHSSRVGNTPYLCFADFVTKGVIGTNGPGLERYLDALTEGTSGEAKWAGEEAASIARVDFLSAHTRHGKCAPLDEGKYEWWVQKMSAERDWPEAHYLLALRYGYGGFADGGVKSIGKYALPASSDARHIPLWANNAHLAGAIPNDWGNGQGLDLAKSFAMLEKAAEGGYLDAQWFLSHAYEAGFWGMDNALEVGVDYEKSTYWMERFAESVDDNDGVYFAFYTLGHRYRHAAAFGLQPDDAKAYAYMAKAAASEDRHSRTFDAMLELALMHRDGAGVASSAEDARAWLERAAQELALMEEEGRKALDVLREEENIALVQNVLEEKREKFQEAGAVLASAITTERG